MSLVPRSLYSSTIFSHGPGDKSGKLTYWHVTCLLREANYLSCGILYCCRPPRAGLGWDLGFGARSSCAGRGSGVNVWFV